MSIDERRTVRLPLHIPVEISFAVDGEPRLERTNTISIDRHGACIVSLSQHPVGSRIHVLVPHLGRAVHGRVVWCSAPINAGFELGIEFETDADLWGVPFTPVTPHTPRPPSADTLPQAFTLLLQILQEKSVLKAGEFEARFQGTIRHNDPKS